MVKKKAKLLDELYFPTLLNPFFISGISSKIFKTSSMVLTPILKTLFSHCIKNMKIPTEWKCAIVTPIYKQKGLIEDVNNYRGISVISPVAKLFEKILAMQIIDYLNKEKIIFNGQHGFRNNHSCETALHELITEMNRIRSKREIGIFFFIDFRKAFDLVDSKLLIFKMKKYGFNQQAIELITNYFNDRTQVVKYDNHISSPLPINLSVPQGSVLGPILFLLFINDLPSYVKSIGCKMFADDTTLFKSGKEVNQLLSSFKDSINDLMNWCKYNRVDINWSKTYCMFINKTRNITPDEILIDNKRVEVVSSFRLLGVTIDNKLSFLHHCRDLRKNINKRLYSIKRIFYLPFSVKIQFFKTFILPFFDYCSTLLIYYPKESIQKLANAYNQCLFKLLGIKFNDYN